MLPKAQRFPLRQHPDFFRTASHRHGRLLSVAVKPASQWQAAVVVSKKTAALAVGRHSLKRKVFEALSVQPQLPPRSIVVVVKPAGKNATQAELQEELQSLLSKVSS